MNIKDKTYLSVREAAEYTGYSVGYLYKLIAASSIPFYVPNGGRIIFTRVELDKWIKNSKKIRKHGNRKTESLIIR